MAHINLLPWREELREEKRKQFLLLLGAFAGLALLISGSIHFVTAKKIQNQVNSNNFLKSEIKVLEKQLEEIADLQRDKERLLARMKIIQQLQSNRPTIVKIFDNLVRTLPDGLYLTKLQRKGKQIVMEGRAESNSRVSKFMRNIESSDWLENPTLSLIEAKDASGANSNDFNLKANQVGPSSVEKDNS